MIRKLLHLRVTKWCPITAYTSGLASRLVMMRRREDGLVQFRTARLNMVGSTNCAIPHIDIDGTFKSVLLEDLLP